jgi:hypothetical protein
VFTHSYVSAQVVLVSRHTFKKREFEVDPMYFGNKGLYEFRVCAFDAPPPPRSLACRRHDPTSSDVCGRCRQQKTKEPRTRLQMCLRARDHATINRHMWKRVQVRCVEPQVNPSVDGAAYSPRVTTCIPAGLLQARAPGHSTRVCSDERDMGRCTMAGEQPVVLLHLAGLFYSTGEL